MKQPTVLQLKTHLKRMHLPTSGRKLDLQLRLKTHNTAVLLQRNIRGWIARLHWKLRGPAFKSASRHLCVNSVDFLTLDAIESIPLSQFVSFKDGAFVYGFDLLSLHNLFLTTPSAKNPFSQSVFPPDVSLNVNKIIRLCKMLRVPVKITLPNVTNHLTDIQQIEMQAVQLFHHIDSLGNYTNSNWILTLTKPELFHYLRELDDIWNYRSMISEEMKRTICPPHGNPFIHLPSNLGQMSTNGVRKCVLQVIHNMVCTSRESANQCLGAFYVLSCLTLFNMEAAEALPWLYESAAANL